MPTLTQESIDSEYSEPTEQSANSIASSDTVQLEMIKLLKEISREIKTLKTNQKNPNAPVTPNNPTKVFKKTPDNQTHPPRRKTGKYCWTHGHCNHNGPDCAHKAEGHKDEATKTNRMGGSNACST